ncbi:MAG TPA: EAL domain-containing protein [Nocardioides sp.]|nr:EAL domain-containing protein [Nocardioides sp.]
MSSFEASRPPTRRRFDRHRPSLRLMRPFGVVAGIGLATVLVPPYEAPAWVLVATTLNYLLIALLLVLSVRTGKSELSLASAYVAFPFVALIREAAGGQASGLSALVFLPVLWLAVTGVRRDVYVASLLTGVIIMAPVLLIGAPRYPAEDWRRALIMLAIAFVLGRVVQRIVERLEKETRFAQSATERSERLFLDAPHGIAVLDDQGRIELANDALGVIVGAPPEELVGKMLTDLAPAGDGTVGAHVARILNHEALLGLVADDTPGASTVSDCVLRNARGQNVHVALNSRMLMHNDLNEPDVILVSVVDVSERRRYQDRLAHLVDHDVLTGLANRRRFDNELQRHLERARRYGQNGAVLLLDLDNFKQVNDSLGHNAGDQLLVTIGGLLRRSVRQTDVVARLGGDEFAVLLTDGDQSVAERIAQDIVDRIGKHAATLDGVNRRVTASVGAVTFQAASEHSTDILALADMTMYDAKEAGRNQIAILPEGETRPPRFSARLQWQSRIEEALEHDRFELHLQPIMNLANNRISSAEVLLRLRDQDELVPPTRFVYIAERTGLMPQVDAWVVEHSLEMLAKLRQRDPGFELEVNLSGHSIGHPDIERTIRESLARHDVDPAALILEITETAAVADVGLARAFAERMTDLGCAFALDDFGAGFGSFYYLKHLLFDYVKIDGEFVAHVHESQVDRTIMRSIVGIAKDLGKKTVAEFVSDPRILEVVRAEGVDYAQGFLIGRPAPYDEFVEKFMDLPVAAALRA